MNRVLIRHILNKHIIAGGLSAIAAIMVATLTPATAAPITAHYTVSVTGLGILSGPSPAPFDPMQASFIISFDPTQNYSLTSSGITLESTNIPYTQALGFVFNTSNDQLLVGTYDPGPALNLGFDLSLTIAPTTGAVTSLNYGRYLTSGGGYYANFNPTAQTATVTTEVVGTPEPASLTILGIGLAGLAAVVARLRRSALKAGSPVFAKV